MNFLGEAWGELEAFFYSFFYFFFFFFLIKSSKNPPTLPNPPPKISVKSYAIKKHNAMYFHFLVSISHFDRKFCIAHAILVTFVSPVTV